MTFAETRLRGAYTIDLERREDERGFFARAWCEQEFAAHGLNTRLVQVNMSSNPRQGTVRGLHAQRPPHAETKLVRCVRGAIHDVIVDVRPGSPTYLQWVGVELSEDNHRMLYVPEGFAHGFITLRAHSTVFYQVSEFYAPGAEFGIRWNDPRLGITWPVAVEVISDKDRTWPDYQPQTVGAQAGLLA